MLKIWENAHCMDPQKERQLVESARIDRSAFGELYDYYYKPIFNYILRNCMNIHIAEDLTADTFFAALNKLPSFKFRQGARFSSWLYKIATNKVYEYFRKGRAYRFKPSSIVEEFYNVGIPSSEIVEAENEINKAQTYKVIYPLIRKMDIKYQTIIQLYYFEDMNYEQISEVTGIKVGTLKSHLSRALSKLKKNMKKMQLIV